MQCRWFQLAMIGLFLASSSIVSAATFVIDNPTDDPVEGTCSLREALLAINTKAEVNGCPEGTGNDRIELERGVVYSLSRQLQVGGMRERVVLPPEETEETDETESGNDESDDPPAQNEDGSADEPVEDQDQEGDSETTEGETTNDTDADEGEIVFRPVSARVRMVAVFGDASDEDEEDSSLPVIQAAHGARAICTAVGSELLMESVSVRGGVDQNVPINPVTHVENPEDEEARICGPDPDGGLIYSQGRLSVSGNAFFEGGRARNGGALLLAGSNPINLNNVLFRDNHAGGVGGAIATSDNYSSRISLDSFYIGENSAVGSGGGIFVEGRRNVLVDAINGTIAVNRAGSGGTGLHIGNTDDHRLAMNNVSIVKNQNTGGARAGLYVGYATDNDEIINSAIIGNEPSDVFVDNLDGGLRASGCITTEDTEDRIRAAYVMTGSGCSGLNLRAQALPVNDGLSTSGEMNIFLGMVDGAIAPCPTVGECLPIPGERINGEFPGYLPNFNRSEFGPTLFDTGSPETEVRFVCSSIDQRGLARADRCDIGALEFGRAEGVISSFSIVIGEIRLLDVLENDLRDAGIDCRLLEEPDNCIEIVQPSTRPGVLINLVIDEETGYPMLEYDSQRGFDGYDFFSYQVDKGAFIGSTFANRDVGATVSIESRPASGMTKKRDIDDIMGLWNLFALMVLIIGGCLRRHALACSSAINAKTKAKVCIGMLVMAFSSSVISAEIPVNNMIDQLPYQPVRGECTLREAVQSAIDKLPSDTFCAPGQTGEDIIVLPEGTLRLKGPIETGASNRVRIEGAGVDQTIIEPACIDDLEDEETGECIEGHRDIRLFEADSSIAFANLTLRKGTAVDRGGIILARRNVSLFQVKVEEGKAEEGGAIFLDFNDDERRDVRILKSYFVNNSATRGGVLSMFAQTQVHDIQALDTTFHANTASDAAGALDLNLPAGSSAVIINSTFFENSSENGGSAIELSNLGQQTNVNLVSNTFLGNTGGIGPINLGSVAGRVVMSNSIYAGEPADCASANGVFNNLVFNVFTGPQASQGCRGANVVNNDFGANLSLIRQALNNGELTDEVIDLDEMTYIPPHLPVTEVMPLIVDAGNPTDPVRGVFQATLCRIEDLRGALRTVGESCDRGAYEIQLTTAMTSSGNNGGRRTRSALIDVIANDISGDSNKLLAGTISIEPLLDDPEFDNTLGSVRVVRRLDDNGDPIGYQQEEQLSDANNSCGVGNNIVTETQTGEDGLPVHVSWSSNSNTGTEDDDCIVLYQAPPLSCGAFPFEDRFKYQVKAREFTINDDGEKIPGTQYSSSTAEVIVNIRNVAPRVPEDRVQYTMKPGEVLVFDLPEDDFYDPDGQIVSIEAVDNSLPSFTIADVDPDDETNSIIVGVGLIIDEANRQVTYNHKSTFSTFTDRFQLRFVDDCGEAVTARFEINFPHASASGGQLLKGTSGSVSPIWLFLILAGFARRFTRRAVV